MTLVEITNLVAKRTGYNRSEARQLFLELFDVMVERLQHGDSVKVRGFGTFRWVDTASRRYRLPNNGRLITTALKRKVRFTASWRLMEANMEKYGVQLNPSNPTQQNGTKEASTRDRRCAVCNEVLDSGRSCPTHGTEPLEARQEKQ